MTQFFSLSLCILFFGFSELGFANLSAPHSTASLLQEKNLPTPFDLYAKVLKKFPCPVCPPKVVCEACIGEHLLVGGLAEEMKGEVVLKTSQLQKNQTIIFGPITELTVGKSYRFKMNANDSEWTPTLALSQHYARRLHFQSATEVNSRTLLEPTIDLLRCEKATDCTMILTDCSGCSLSVISKASVQEFNLVHNLICKDYQGPIKGCLSPKTIPYCIEHLCEIAIKN